MSEITDAFKKVLKKEVPDEKMLVPLLKWLSGSYTNIENMQAVNRKFLYVNRKILIVEVILNNNVTHFIPYPKVPKDDSKLKFFYNDMAKYFGWTTNELRKNLSVINIEQLKTKIADAFGYENKERKYVGVEIIEGITHGQRRKKASTRQTRTASTKRKSNRERTQRSLKECQKTTLESGASIVSAKTY